MDAAVAEACPVEGGMLFLRDDGQAGCPQCGTVYATTSRERPTDCVICDYDRVVEDARKVVPIDRARTRRRAQAKVGRNDPCPCGSGRKAKKCHPEVTT